MKQIFWTGITGLLTAPVFVLAQGTGGERPDGGGTGGGGRTEVLEGPINASNVEQVLNRIIDALLLILSPIAVIMTIYAGYLFMTAGGNEDKVKAARHTLLYVIVGVAVLILSKGIVSLVTDILN